MRSVTLVISGIVMSQHFRHLIVGRTAVCFTELAIVFHHPIPHCCCHPAHSCFPLTCMWSSHCKHCSSKSVTTFPHYQEPYTSQVHLRRDVVITEKCQLIGNSDWYCTCQLPLFAFWYWSWSCCMVGLVCLFISSDSKKGGDGISKLAIMLAFKGDQEVIRTSNLFIFYLFYLIFIFLAWHW